MWSILGWSILADSPANRKTHGSVCDRPGRYHSRIFSQGRNITTRTRSLHTEKTIGCLISIQINPFHRRQARFHDRDRSRFACPWKWKRCGPLPKTSGLRRLWKSPSRFRPLNDRFRRPVWMLNFDDCSPRPGCLHCECREARR